MLDSRGRLFATQLIAIAAAVIIVLAVGTVWAAAIALAVGALVAWIHADRLSRGLNAIAADAETTAGVPPTSGRDAADRLRGAVRALAEQLEQRVDTIARERGEVLAILESMIEGVVAVDRTQRLVLINDEARRLLETPAMVSGRPIWEITRLNEVCDIIDLVLRGAPEAKDEISLPGRGDRFLELHATQLRSRDNEVHGAVVVIHDITALRRLETVRRDFVTNVSHELKTPLTAIRGFVETLLDDKNTAEDTRIHFLGKIRDHAQRMSDLVTDLLALSKIESQATGTGHTELDLREPARASAALIASRAEDEGIQLHVEIPDCRLDVVGDGDMLRLVIDNLLDNAVKYTPRDGEVWLRLMERDQHVVVEVQDTGVGLDPNQQRRVFERFYRVDRSRSRGLGGTGLGLSIVKHVVLSHRGEVSVESSPGAGTTFRVELPHSASPAH